MATEATSRAPTTPAPSDGARTIGATWRRACTSGREDPAYPRRDGGRLGAGVVGGRVAARRRARERAAGARARSRETRFGILGNTSLEWALLDFALARLGAITACRSTRRARTATASTSSSTPRRSGSLVEDEAHRARIETLRGDLPGIRHLLTFADLDGLAESGRAHRQAHPDAVTDAESRIDRGRPLHDTSTRRARRGRPRAA